MKFADRLAKRVSKEELLEKVNEVVRLYPPLKQNFYLEFNRRFKLIEYMMVYVKYRGKVCDVGAAPFILSAMMKQAGYEVVAVDINPEEYGKILERFKIPAFRVDLERDNLPFRDESFDAVVFSEVLEHLNPYYIYHTLSEIKRILKKNGVLILTTPNIASLFRRLKLLIGKNPIYKYHVREYTLNEVREILEDSGFEVQELFYSEIYDLSLLKPKSEEELQKLVRVESFFDMLKFTVRNIALVNVARVVVYPLVKLVPQLRTQIVAIAQKRDTSALRKKRIRRWG
jgi:SAM-dependent methyltransferase